ncbi:MAG: glycerol-3-phosphate responsive antiterminator [Firmicutes bacterium]|nr:glycerol-3-phosphate responsive antiterminator [Bacillota bacterium]
MVNKSWKTRNGLGEEQAGGNGAMHKIIERIEENPIIAAVRDAQGLKLAMMSPVTTIFILRADIFNIKRFVEEAKEAGKNVFIHMDFLEGIGKDHKAIDYIVQVIGPDGIISTKSSHIKYAKEKGIFTVQRFFLIDSQSYETTIKTVYAIKPDMVEIMPGVMPGIIRRIADQISAPVIAGGLIDSKEDIVQVLKAGALGASTGKKGLWEL